MPPGDTRLAGTGCPHVPQNLKFAGTWAPHFAHLITSALGAGGGCAAPTAGFLALDAPGLSAGAPPNEGTAGAATCGTPTLEGARGGFTAGTPDGGVGAVKFFG